MSFPKWKTGAGQVDSSCFVWEAGVAVLKKRKLRNYFSECSKSSPFSSVIAVKFHNQARASLSLGTGEHTWITNCCVELALKSRCKWLLPCCRCGAGITPGSLGWSYCCPLTAPLPLWDNCSLVGVKGRLCKSSMEELDKAAGSSKEIEDSVVFRSVT